MNTGKLIYFSFDENVSDKMELILKQKDVNVEYFMEGRNGGWNYSDIFSFQNISVSNLKGLLSACVDDEVDFIMLVYWGKHFINDNGELMLKLNKREDLPVKQLKSWLKKTRTQLVVGNTRCKIVRARKCFRWKSNQLQMPKKDMRKIYMERILQQPKGMFKLDMMKARH
ncbi:hypothetical protein [uncultured Bacteroides sp.]|uniref:hypothetical protein n=1 Tax=uncultured Bacteroides sp. TaxID=162156 RepID=UPI00261925C4|nr:hypothetical protein [uncultured Bacteroides sp.]